MSDQANRSAPAPVKEQARRQNALYWITIGAGVAFSLITYLLLNNKERNRSEARFEWRVEQHQIQLRAIVDRYVDQLYGLRTLFQYSEDVTREEFRYAARELRKRHDSIQVLEWVPRVSSSQRPVYETEARKQGMAGFQFTEKERGQLVPASERPEHLPIYYVEPLEGNEAALGYDLTLGPTTNELKSARDSGEATGSAIIGLVQEKTAKEGWIILVPVYRSKVLPETVEERRQYLAGYVQGVFRIEELLNHVFRGDASAAVDWLVTVKSEPGGTSPKIIYHRIGGPRDPHAAKPTVEEYRRGGAREIQFNAAGRLWHLWYRPNKFWRLQEKSWHAEAFFFGGLILTGLLAANMRAQQERAGVVERLVRDKTEQLRQANQVLQKQFLEQRQLEEQVRLSQKMEAIGLLAGGIAHDFNNLLQVIQGHTLLAMDETVRAEERKDSLEQVRHASESAARLTRQLLAFGRRQDLVKEDLDLNVLSRELLKMLRRVIGEHIEIDLIPGHELGNVRADRAQIEQVLLNLCVNARDAMPKGGRLTIELENVLINGSFRESHPWAKPGRYVLLSVSDTGVGVDETTRSRIFEPFFTTKPKDRGTGLGLAVVYGIVKQHDGMIHVYSEPNLGTTFKIYLPIVERAAVTVGHKLAPIAPSGTETILLVEDEAAVRALAAKVLERAGYRVLPASDGMEACRLFSEHEDSIALILMDVVMPKMGGKEAYEKIAAVKPGVSVIFCSGYSEGALQSGFDFPATVHLLQKPYVPDELLAKVRSMLDRRD